MNDPFFETEAGWSGDQLSTGRAKPAGFCGARIHPDCLGIAGDGTVRVGLSVSAAKWFQTLPRLGEVLHVVRNSVALMVCRGQVPLLDNWHEPILPFDRLGTYGPNLTEYASLAAVREPSPVGVLFGLEARDVSGIVFERILLTSQSHLPNFERFISTHQSPPFAAESWYPPNHATGSHRRFCIAQRIPWLRSRSEGDRLNGQLLPSELFPRLLAICARNDFPVRITHFSRGVIRATIWTPQVEKSDQVQSGPSFGGRDVSLHLNRSAIGSVWLSVGKCECCHQEFWKIEVGDVHDQCSLVLMTGNQPKETEWRRLIQACLA